MSMKLQKAIAWLNEDPVDMSVNRRARRKLSSDPSREEMVSFLAWNDPNGIYSDDLHTLEYGCAMSAEDAEEAIIIIWEGR